jgi:hypothetical protein
VRLGLITDEGLVPDPETIIAGFHAEFDEMLAFARRADEKPSMRKMSAMLDNTLMALDGILEEGGKEAATTQTGSATPPGQKARRRRPA